MILQLKNIQKSIGVEEILNDISFILEEREKAALVGINGAGKTSVFRIITRQWQPDEGVMTMSSGVTIGYLPQLAETDPNLIESIPTGNTLYDVLDAVFEPLKKIEAEIRAIEERMTTQTGQALDASMERYSTLTARFESADGYSASSRVRGVLKGLSFTEDQWKQSFAELSGGQKTRALLGRLLLESPDIMLLDEPTNHLDIESVAWLEEYLRSSKSAVILISHDRYFMDKVVTKTIEIEGKVSTVYNGNYTYFTEKKARDRALAEKQFAENQKIIKHHESVIKTLRSYSTEAAIIRAKSREKLLAKIERVEKPANDPTNMRLRLKPKITSGHDVLSVEDLSMAFGEKHLFSNVSFEVKKGDRIALIGANGIGKTTLLKILMGELTPITGRIREGVNVRHGYYDQAQDHLSEEKNIFQELADTYPRLTQTEIRTVLGAFVFIGDDVFKPISALSGGERGRVALAKIMLAGANFLILDEPTNHLDLYSKEILEEALRDFQGTLLYISHDRYFINNTANMILEMEPTGLRRYLGNYDYYMEKKAEELAMLEMEASSPDVPPINQKEEYQRKKEQDSAARRKKSQVDKLEAQIAKAEAQIADCDARLNDEAVSRDAEAAAAVYAEKINLEEELAMLYDDWESLSE
ncbi:MAG: ABC-F family ATP-binding cassette domain-containing protein [Defluviitaleaceae bacterium]|nr:ABC-F family ATP-binding cassette domain-containing protein [Defluviitaleaceae bacterium]